MKISTHKPKKDGPSRQYTEEDTEIGLILHISVSDEKLFPEAQSKEFCKTYDNSEKRVYINNYWQIKDTTGILKIILVSKNTLRWFSDQLKLKLVSEI